MAFYKNFRKYLHAVEIFSGALLLFIGALVFANKLTWLTGKLGFLQATTARLEEALTKGIGAIIVWLLLGLLVFAIVVFALLKSSFQGKKVAVVVASVLLLIGHSQEHTELDVRHGPGSS